MVLWTGFQKGSVRPHTQLFQIAKATTNVSNAMPSGPTQMPNRCRLLGWLCSSLRTCSESSFTTTLFSSRGSVTAYHRRPCVSYEWLGEAVRDGLARRPKARGPIALKCLRARRDWVPPSALGYARVRAKVEVVPLRMRSRRSSAIRHWVMGVSLRDRSLRPSERSVSGVPHGKVQPCSCRAMFCGLAVGAVARGGLPQNPVTLIILRSGDSPRCT